LLAQGTDWRKVVAVKTAQHMLIRGLIDPAGAAGSYTLTDQGRAVLEVLMMKATTRGQ
jgi:hypothetical protein